MLLVELLLRVLWPIAPLSAFVEASREADFSDRQRVTIFTADPWLLWRLVPNLREVTWDFTLVTTNAQGLRRDRPVGPKPAGTFRILCVGDSVTFGYRVPLVLESQPIDREEQPYPQLLEKALAGVEVVSLAVPGYTSAQGRRWLERDLSRYQPDLVTLCFGWNDVSVKGRPDSQSLPRSGLEVGVRTVIAHSQLATRLARLGRRPAQGSAEPRVTQEQYCQNLLAMVDLVRLQGAVAVVIAPVYRDARTNSEEATRLRAYREALLARCRAENVLALVVPELTEAGSPANHDLFGELIHPNAAGHRLLAERLLGFLRDNALLPR